MDAEQWKLVLEIWNQIKAHPIETIFGAIVMLPMVLAAWANQQSMNKEKKGHE